MTSEHDRIAKVFAALAPTGRAALIPYIAVGDPSPTATVPLMHALAAGGADIIELGVPFSDPMADGPVIQRAAERAIAQGIGLPQVLTIVSEFRQSNTHTPIVLMGYANPIERMGQQAFVERASQAGVDGVLVVDYPPEEIKEFATYLGDAGIAPIFLLAPTSTETRIRAVSKVARGYVYYVSLKGVTGSANIDTAAIAERLTTIRRHVSLPIGVGFGISDAESAARVARVADAVVIGSKLIDTVDRAVRDLPKDQQDAAAVSAATEWLSVIRKALDTVQRDSTAA